jgi:hypothetical protein
MALTSQSGWRYQPRARDDDKRIPSRLLPAAGLRAELWLESSDEGTDGDYIGDAQFVVTDQVRFRSMGSGEVVALVDVPSLVFSEVMRDVDVFVAVCSLGNDPFAGNYGPNERRAYWQRYAFGDLPQTARTRHGVFAQLLPRLTKLADRWSIVDRFLIVRGDLRAYKIHLGSGNVLMEPNDQYLCIVRDQNADAGARIPDLCLPFEGDLMLSTIVSKALLLVADSSITDPSITLQIERAG